MAKNLVIVESPAKAKTIEKILGKDFEVRSSLGHIRDLKRGNDAIDVENNFKPKYEVSPDKRKVVKELKDRVKRVDEVWLATDEDREGEAISWHLCKVLGLDEATTKRIVFREITRPAIQKAIQSPRRVDLNLVNAQQARRVLDRLVGFELSELLWKKVKGKLSAGRVQSVAVKLIVEREREIQDFEAKPFYRIEAIFKVANEQGKLVDLKAELPGRFDTEGDARQFLEDCNGAAFKINKIDVKPIKRKPTAPFTTSTLQQEASRKLGFSVKRTMTNAQRLYEQGFITYMRTDSVTLSETAILQIAQEIEKSYGKEYLQTRRFKNKKQSAQEAHEAIRPSYIDRQVVTTDRDQQRLYDLIWKRTIASQMAEAKLEKTIVQIGINTRPEDHLKAEGEVLIFDGFLKVYLAAKDDDDDEEAKGILPPLKVGQMLDLDHMTGIQRFTRPPARYTEASLVKKLEELGIGRPSTYAPTISKIMEEGRGYVFKGESEGEPRNYQMLTLHKGAIVEKTQTEKTGSNKNRLVPSDMGMIVSDFLSKHFEEVMDYSFTAGVEKQLDQIAEGEEKWVQMMKDFYGPFHSDVLKAIETADRASGERILGTDPESGRTVLVRMSRLGRPVVQIGAPDELDEDEKPRYANLTPGQTLETLNFEEAMKLFQLPRTLGTYEDQEVSIGIGRFGPYVKHGDTFISIPRSTDPMEITFDQAAALIEVKKAADAPIFTYKDLPVTKGKGRFGPFLKWNGLFINIPRRFDPELITKEESMELIEAKEKKEANRYIHNWVDEKISVENGRWGPFIRFKRKNLKLPKQADGNKYTSEDAAKLTLEQVKEMIEAQAPGSFKKKKAPARKKAPAKKKAK